MHTRKRYGLSQRRWPLVARLSPATARQQLLLNGQKSSFPAGCPRCLAEGLSCDYTKGTNGSITGTIANAGESCWINTAADTTLQCPGRSTNCRHLAPFCLDAHIFTVQKLRDAWNNLVFAAYDRSTKLRKHGAVVARPFGLMLYSPSHPHGSEKCAAWLVGGACIGGGRVRRVCPIYAEYPHRTRDIKARMDHAWQRCRGSRRPSYAYVMDVILLMYNSSPGTSPKAYCSKQADERHFMDEAL